ncbi:MAG: tRNA pseudouridine55 synthase [Hyphomonadaceae bacterium]|nr:MAG: tRNA pseudouridine55 synthase [Hyphomonadaceae bacterium]
MGRRNKGLEIDGWLVLDKDLELTSTAAVNRVRRAFGAKKAGHAGTLDPLATGILPIALGDATRTVAWLMEATKSYIFTIEWGTSTDSQDKEGIVIASSDIRPNEQAIKNALIGFIGEIEQVPPKFSAIKVNGERAYDLARGGDEFELNARKVVLHSARLVGVTANSATIEATCGKGFYVRALARDLAQKLGAEGHISALRRTQVGPFKEAAAITLEKLEKLCIEGTALLHLLPTETALDDIPELAISAEDMFNLRQGRQIMVFPTIMEALKSKRKPRTIAGQDMSAAVLATFEGLAVAIGDVRAGKFQPVRVFNLKPS